MKAFGTYLILTCSILAICTNTKWVIAADVEAPRLDYAQLNVSPLIQGVEGALTIQTYVQVNGTC